MAVKAHKLGPGHLTFGDVGSLVEFGVALRECTVEPSVDEGNTVKVLSGDEIEDGETESYSLKGKVYQSYDRDSLLIWAHVHAGELVPFTFEPSDDAALGVKGTIKVRRINIGGKVDERNETDFEFPGRNGMYDLYDLDDAAKAPVTAYPAPAHQ